jgi:hypothetical protein
MADLSPLAGLHVAPEYDKSKELDPSKVQAVNAPFDVEKLEYFQKRQEKRTWYARVTLLGALVFLICMDIWVATVHHEAAIAEITRNRSEQLINLNQARMDQAALQELTNNQIDALVAQVELLQGQVDAEGGTSAEATTTEAAIVTGEPAPAK